MVARCGAAEGIKAAEYTRKMEAKAAHSPMDWKQTFLASSLSHARSQKEWQMSKFRHGVFPTGIQLLHDIEGFVGVSIFAQDL